MTDRKKVGVRVDADVWEAFREDVKARKGQTRGVLGDELEAAIRQYLGEDHVSSANDRLQRVERIVTHLADDRGLAVADGVGVGAPSDGETHTRAPSRIDAAAEEKPAPNAATEKKIRYFAERVREREDWVTEAAEALPAADDLPDAALDNKIARARYVDGPADLDESGSVPDALLDRVTDAERHRLRQYRAGDESAARPPVAATTRETLRDVVREAYGFRRDTARRYVAELREYFDLVEHPDDPERLRTRERLEADLDREARTRDTVLADADREVDR